jgi:hypothetical protein
MNCLIYSPRPAEEYSRLAADGERLGVGAELASLDHRALWNLYWLSDDAVDSFIDGTWEQSPRINFRMVGACGKALNRSVGGVSVREVVLMLNPIELLERFAANAADVKRLPPYRLAGQAWLDTLTRRCGLFRGVAKVEGSVIYAQFGRSQKDNVTGAARSAKIMPLALTKSDK